LHNTLYPPVGKGLDFSNALAKPRNDVAHAGKQPTDQEVSAALETARLMLDEVCPLPSSEQ